MTLRAEEMDHAARRRGGEVERVKAELREAIAECERLRARVAELEDRCAYLDHLEGALEGVQVL